MPRPTSPLRSSYSAYNEHDSVLTPRTPHSRAGRDEQDRFLHSLNPDLELDADGEYHELDAATAQQNAPLLTSSANGSVRKLSRLDRTIWAAIRQRMVLAIGICGIIFLFFLLVIPNKTPATSDHLSVSVPSSNSSMHMMLSYSEYDSFPLEPLTYREECAKFQAGMKGPMGTFWYIPSGGPADVPHKEDSKICTSSITYVLDGYVGIAADLALMAQAAGLAREVSYAHMPLLCLLYSLQCVLCSKTGPFLLMTSIGTVEGELKSGSG